MRKGVWRSGVDRLPQHALRRRALAWLIMGALWAVPLPVSAKLLWQHPQPTRVYNDRLGVDVLHGALPPRDDTARETLYFKFRVNPQADVLKERGNTRYLAGMTFCYGGIETFGIGNAWDAYGYSAFCKSFNVAGNAPGELNLTTDQPEAGNQPFLQPRSGALTKIVVKVEYVPGEEDLVTVWLNPNLAPGATEQQQSEQIVTHFKADASFDQLRLVHEGAGQGWVFDDLAVATSFQDFAPLPLWRRAWFQWLAGIGLVAAAMGMVVAAERHKAWRMQLKLQAAEREQALTAERVRIAQDLHDDLGARVTEIVMLGEQAKAKGMDNPSLQPILAGLRQLHGSLDEAVWSINPGNDSLVELVEYICEYAERFLQHASTSFHLELAENLPEVAITATQRHNLLLAVKEALSNAVRHAAASSIRLQIEVTTDGLQVTVADNGCGMATGLHDTGNGLHNMSARLIAIGGKTEIRSQPGQGTLVIFSLPLQN